MKKFLLENRVYNNIMKSAARHVRRDDGKPILKGVYFEIEQNKVRITALDGYRMVHYVVTPEDNTELEPATFVMPPIVVPAHKNACVEVDYSDVSKSGRIQITETTDDITISRRVYTGEFVSYRKILPPTHEAPAGFVVNAEYLVDALSAAIAIGNDKYVKITFDANDPTKPVLITKCSGLNSAAHLVLPAKAYSGTKIFDTKI